MTEAKSISVAEGVIREYIDAVDRSVSLPYLNRVTTFKNFVYLKSMSFPSNRLMRMRFDAITTRIQNYLKKNSN